MDLLLIFLAKSGTFIVVTAPVAPQAVKVNTDATSTANSFFIFMPNSRIVFVISRTLLFDHFFLQECTPLGLKKLR